MLGKKDKTIVILRTSRIMKLGASMVGKNLLIFQLQLGWMILSVISAVNSTVLPRELSGDYWLVKLSVGEEMRA